MRIEEQIKEKLQKSLEPEGLEVVNQSHLHKGHAGDDGSGQTHFKVTVVAEAFSDMNRVQRQRKVMEILRDLFPLGLHALSISAVTPSENNA